MLIINGNMRYAIAINFVLLQAGFHLLGIHQIGSICFGVMLGILFFPGIIKDKQDNK